VSFYIFRDDGWKTWCVSLRDLRDTWSEWRESGYVSESENRDKSEMEAE
jgi:hypothetical protein